jgi:hypothetical protein
MNENKNKDSSKFLKLESSPHLNPVDYFNFYGNFISIFEGLKNFNAINENEAALINPKDLTKDLNKATFILNNGLVDVVKDNEYDLAKGSKISKFMLLSSVMFKGDYFAAMSYVSFQLMKSEIPYIRVGTDYFKVITKSDRYEAINTILKPWKKDEIKEDHGKQLLSRIFKFDDFTILPNNVQYLPVYKNCYNLYSKFSHDPASKDVLAEHIPTTLKLITHIFGEQWQLGLKYMKILYEFPRQILPVLALVSTQRETGKTTFLNWIQMIFGENSTLINPADLMSNFNDGYATKNIIMVDETVIDKAHVIEKLKSIATAKTMSVSQKFVSHYAVPFFGKVIVCTNKETDFMRIDEEEIRFWVRKIKPIEGTKNTNIELDLFTEIPLFLRFLTQLPEVDFSKSRMVFTQDEIATESLQRVKLESHSTLRKEIEYFAEDFFNNFAAKTIHATAKDVKEKWFANNNQISVTYIRKVLKDEMKLDLTEGVERYYSFGDTSSAPKVGQPFIFNAQEDTKLPQMEDVTETINKIIHNASSNQDEDLF